MKRKSLNIKDYTKNAARYFSYTRLIIYTVLSLVLTIALIISIPNIANSFSNSLLKKPSFIFSNSLFFIISNNSIARLYTNFLIDGKS